MDAPATSRGRGPAEQDQQHGELSADRAPAGLSCASAPSTAADGKSAASGSSNLDLLAKLSMRSPSLSKRPLDDSIQYDSQSDGTRASQHSANSTAQTQIDMSPQDTLRSEEVDTGVAGPGSNLGAFGWA